MPLTQVAGNAVKFVCWLTSLLQPLPSRKRNVPLCVPSIASQYGVPEVTIAPEIGILFHAPAVN